MKEYQGTAGDPPVGGGTHIEKHEVCNFVDVDGFCYGFVQQAGWGEINFKKMGILENEVSIEGITVVWIARSPEYGEVIIGFCLNAKLYRTMQFLEKSEKHTENRVGQYYVRCSSDDAHLISSKERKRKFDRIGRSNIWYGDAPDGDEVRSEIEKFIQSYLDGQNAESRLLDVVKNGQLCVATLDKKFEDIQNDLAEIQSLDLPPERKLRLAEARIGQGTFRKYLDAVWNNACAITGCTARPVLRASHIKPWAKCESIAERLSEDNGILLSANFDALFDAGLIGFDDRGVMMISDKVSVDERNILGLGGNLRKTPNSYQAKYLAYHRELHGLSQ